MKKACSSTACASSTAACSSKTKLRALLTAGRYPVRNVTQNLADLRAQIAACQKGIAELSAMTEHYGLNVVQAYMQHVQDNAEAAVRKVIDVLKDGAVQLRDGQRRRGSRLDSHRPCATRSHHRLHRHERAAAQQLQRAAAGDARRGAVRVPHAGG